LPIPDNADTKKLAAIKFTVFFLGIFLIGGVVLLGAVIFQRNQNNAAMHKPVPSCSTAPLTVHTASTIENVTKEGRELTLLSTQTDGKQEIIILDYCTGDIIRTITIER
jgi:hypothetical protein